MTSADRPMAFRFYMLKVNGYATAYPEQAARMRREWKPVWRLYLKTFTPAEPVSPEVDAYYARLGRLRKAREVRRARAIAEWKALTASGLA